MGKHPNLGNLDYLFDKGTDFRLSDRLYQEKTGAALPKEKEHISVKLYRYNRCETKQGIEKSDWIR